MSNLLNSKFNITIINSIENSIDAYANLISEKFNLDSNEIKQLWYDNNQDFTNNPVENTNSNPVENTNSKPVENTNSKPVENTNSNPVENTNSKPINPEQHNDDFKLRLAKSCVAELKVMLKSKGLKVSGKKADLIARILNGGDSKPKKKANVRKNTPKIIKELTENISHIQIRRNSFGNFEHHETRLVFNKETQEVIGKQNDDGTLSDLTKEDIESCNKYKFKYVLPENLNKQTSLDNVKIDEMDDDDDDEDEDDDEEDETKKNSSNELEINDEEDEDEEELEDEDFSDYYE